MTSLFSRNEKTYSELEVKTLLDENKTLKDRLEQKSNQNRILSAELKEVQTE